MPEWMTSPWMILGGAGAGGLVVGLWSHLKGWWGQIVSRIIVTMELNGDAQVAMRVFLFKEFKPSPFATLSYAGWRMFVRSKNRNMYVPVEVLGGNLRILWRGFRFLWISASEQPSGRERAHGDGKMTIRFIRKLYDPDKLVIEAADYFNKLMLSEDLNRYHVVHVSGEAGRMETHSNQPVAATEAIGGQDDILSLRSNRLVGVDYEDIGPKRMSDSGLPFEELIRSPEMDEAIVEAERWKASEDWYQKRGIPWRRGWLLHGKPGTGKTTMARAIAEGLNMPVHVYDLASLSNWEFMDEWRRMVNKAPVVALIEDIDTVFNKRKNVASSKISRNHLTFDCLLNAIDGVEKTDGVFLIVTTNRLDRVDEALAGEEGQHGEIASRPGRVDRVLHLGTPDYAGLEKVAKRILKGYAPEVARLTTEGHEAGDTVAQFQERCSRFALEAYWEEREAAAGQNA